jgi:diguanylate cyclase (GGDEF)-like protein
LLPFILALKHMEELPFAGYQDHIKKPLENDPVSFKRINNLFLDYAGQPNPEPFSYLLKKLVGKILNENSARLDWESILSHKKELELKLERMVSVQVAAVDFYSLQETGRRRPRPSPSVAVSEIPAKQADAGDEWLHRVYAPGYHLERLKDEMMRSRRYNHALSAVMVDVDDFHRINEQASHEVGDTVLKVLVKIIKSTIRAVDIMARYSGDRFLVILPSTNKREALELAERLRNSVSQKTKQVKGCNGGVSITVSVGQCLREEQSIDFMKRLETTLDNGKKKSRNAVYQF